MVLGVFQLALGASPEIVLLTLLSGVIALGPCLAYGLTRTVGIVFLMVWYVYSFGELLTKSLLLQPIDSNLFNPMLSHQIQLAGALALSAGALLAFWFVPLRANLMRPLLDPGALRALSVVFLGVFALSFVVQLAGPNGRAISVFIRNYVFAALVVEIAATLVSSGGRRSISRWGVVIAGLICAMSLASNSKAGILAAGLCFLLTPLSLGRLPSWRFLAAIAPAILLLSVAIAPAIHLVRGERDKLGPIEVMQKTAARAADIIAGDQQVLAQIIDMQRRESNPGHDAYVAQYTGRASVGYDRFILIGFVDAIARRLTVDGSFLGARFIFDQTKDVLPQQLSGEKQTYSSGDRITHILGLTEARTTHYITVPLPVELFAAGGFVLVLLVGTAVAALSSAAINLIAFDFRGNVWATYILITSGYFFTMQGYVGHIFFAVRQLPTDFLVVTVAMFLASLLSRSFPSSPAPRAANPSPTARG